MSRPMPVCASVCRRHSVLWLAALLLLPLVAGAVAQQQAIKPQIPTANRNQKGKVFVEHADELSADEQQGDYQVLRGNVRFRRGDMYMFCDSAHFRDANSSLDAFGHVRMTQGDTIAVYADLLHYYGDDQLAQLRGNVRLENRNTTLITENLDYLISSDEGYYFEGGTIVDSKNNTELRSQNGLYRLNTKEAEFVTDVILVSDEYTMRSNQLNYNTRSHVATIVSPTEIVSDSNVIVTSNGWYNTTADDARLFDRSTVSTRDGRTLTADTLYYNRQLGYGEGAGNMVITDTVNKVILDGDRGYHDDNVHYSYVTGRARAREFSQADTTYLHADTLCTVMNSDSIRVLRAFAGVRFYRADLQGVADSMSLSEADTIIRLRRDAVVWSEGRQISGPEINVHLADSSADWATLPATGLMVEHVGEDYYDQLSGKSMKAYFKGKELRRLDVEGNVMVILYPQEDDSTYNKQVNAESSTLQVLLKPKQEVEKITMWPEVTGKVTPLFLLRRNELYLPKFVWYEQRRPKSPDDIFATGAPSTQE